MNDEKQQKAVYKDLATQKALNTPLKDDSVMAGENGRFLYLLLKLLDEGKIDPYTPASIINHKVYDKLSEESQGKADLEAVNMLAAIRDIQGLHGAGFKDSAQMANTVERLRLTKERIESGTGDIFII
jgi:hypothetical protein